MNHSIGYSDDILHGSDIEPTRNNAAQNPINILQESPSAVTLGANSKENSSTLVSPNLTPKPWNVENKPNNASEMNTTR